MKRRSQGWMLRIVVILSFFTTASIAGGYPASAAGEGGCLSFASGTSAALFDRAVQLASAARGANPSAIKPLDGADNPSDTYQCTGDVRVTDVFGDYYLLVGMSQTAAPIIGMVVPNTAASTLDTTVWQLQTESANSPVASQQRASLSVALPASETGSPLCDLGWHALWDVVFETAGCTATILCGIAAGAMAAVACLDAGPMNLTVNPATNTDPTGTNVEAVAGHKADPIAWDRASGRSIGYCLPTDNVHCEVFSPTRQQFVSAQVHWWFRSSWPDGQYIDYHCDLYAPGCWGGGVGYSTTIYKYDWGSGGNYNSSSVAPSTVRYPPAGTAGATVTIVLLGLSACSPYDVCVDSFSPSGLAEVVRSYAYT
jgi:hypothetical protein